MNTAQYVPLKRTPVHVLLSEPECTTMQDACGWCQAAPEECAGCPFSAAGPYFEEEDDDARA
jgi:hypothetical protein